MPKSFLLVKWCVYVSAFHVSKIPTHITGWASLLHWYEFHIGTKNLEIVEDRPMNIHVQFGFNHICSFWEEGIWTFSHRIPNLAGMFLGWSSTKLLFFVPVGYSIWLPEPIICSDWLKFQRSSSLKLMNWLNPNCKWMIIGMSFTKFLFFMQHSC
jgi:hypothetical protein